MKILLVCNAGMSTSLVVTKMKQALTEEQKDWTIEAHPIEILDEIIDEYDVVLLGPQVSFRLRRVKERNKDKNVPIDVIPSLDYSLGYGDKIVAKAIEMYKGKEK